MTFICCGTLNAHRGLEASLRPAVDAGILPPEVSDSWLRAAENAHRDDARAQRDEAIRSASLATMVLLLAAEERGLASCAMGGFDAAAVAGIWPGRGRVAGDAGDGGAGGGRQLAAEAASAGGRGDGVGLMACLIVSWF